MPRKSHIPNFKRVAERVSAIAVEEVERDVAAFAEEERAAFVQRIERQRFPDFNAAPLNPKYRARKIKMGLDPRVMIRTRHYIDSIRVFHKRDSATRATHHIGFEARETARDHKGQRVPILLRHLAAVHEYGSVKLNIPRRRHWRPHYEAMRARAPARRARIRASIRTRARKAFPKVLA